jgi:hypothetical protein
MKVEIFYFEGCPNYKPASERLRAVIHQEGTSADVDEIGVPNEAAARDLGFLGSPTIRINGVDIEPASRNAGVTGFACRCYAGGLPSTEMIQAALQEASGPAESGSLICI